MSLPHLHAALDRTDWAALAEQKEVLANEVASIRSARALLAAHECDSAADLALDQAESLDGILHWTPRSRMGSPSCSTWPPSDSAGPLPGATRST